VANVLSTPSGQHVVWDILSRAGIYHVTHRGNSESTFLEGVRSLGLQIVAEVGKQGPDAYPDLLRTMNVFEEQLEALDMDEEMNQEIEDG